MFSRMIESLQRFMYGRYGTDQLNVALLVLSFLYAFFVGRAPLPWLVLLGYIPMVWVVFRMFSRNIVRRRAENDKFMKLWNPVKRFFKRGFGWCKIRVNRIKDSKTHRYFHCPDCKQTVRVPKGRGKIIIRCPKCGKEFPKTT